MSQTLTLNRVCQQFGFNPGAFQLPSNPFASSCNPFAVSKVSNPFAISDVSAKVGIPSLSFSLPGVSAAEIAAQLARLRTPPVLSGLPTAPVIPPSVSFSVALVIHPILGSKR